VKPIKATHSERTREVRSGFAGKRAEGCGRSASAIARDFPLRLHGFQVRSLYLIAAVFLLLAAGCGNTPQAPVDAALYVPQILHAAPLERPAEPIAEMTQIARAANEFSFALAAELAQTTGNENFVVSPYSVWLPLAALLNATDDAFKPPLAELLGGAGVNEADINRAASRMMFDLTSGNSPLTIANTVFVRNNERLRRDFAETFFNYYRGTAISVDFQAPETVALVNQWIYDNTNGLISDVVQEFNPDTVLSVINAIHFYDRWAHEFHSGRTAPGDFYSPGGTSPAYFMRSEITRFYFEDDLVQATHLAFSQGGGMYIFLPKSGDATGVLSSMTPEYFEYIRNNGGQKHILLKLPRFSIESNWSELNGTLIELGVPLFCEFSAPLTGGLVYGDIPLHVASASQAATIDVNEYGTTAAAATMMIVPQSQPPPPETEMICNTPFVFVLYQNTFDGDAQIIFIGVVNAP